MRPRVALCSEDPRVRERVGRWLSARGHVVLDAPEPGADACVLAYPACGGRGRLEELARRRPRPALIALCPHGSHEAALAALKAGADDCLLAPWDAEELELKLARALAVRRQRGELPDQARGGTAAAPAGRILGSSLAIRELRSLLERAAAGRATVLITGETGTGKELAASRIHELSARRGARMVKVNCAALPDPLLESELFGHERGAFTGAEQRRVGRFEEAHGGTLFLDEVGDMHARTQAKVLRVLQEQEFERLGGTRPIRVNVRVIAATNQDLRELIARGRFREDLLFRLDVVSLVLPALRERPEDIPELALAFLAELEGGRSQEVRGITPDALAALRAHSWPGNVRELRNAIERAVVMGQAPWIEVHELGLEPERSSAGRADELVRLPPGGVDYREVERSLLLQALERVGWVQKRAAALLRMSRRQLNYRVRRLGITHEGWPKNRGATRDSAQGE